MKTFVTSLTVAALTTMTARAQSCTFADRITTTSLYGATCIELGPGFDTTTSGFEAKIRLPEATAGRWSPLLPWTDFVRTAGGPVGMVGIHTHVLPNGLVLTWEGHNDDAAPPGGTQGHLSHAYAWVPTTSTFQGGGYNGQYLHYDNEPSNIFCSGHAFLADGRLLVAGGHYSNGAVVRTTRGSYDSNLPVNSPSNDDYIPGTSNVNGSVGLRDVNFFSYLKYPSSRDTDTLYAWQTPKNYPFGPYRMKYRRWYPTATTLADGRVLVTAGQRYGGDQNNPLLQAEFPEVFTPGSGGGTGSWQTLMGAQRKTPSYPWMFQLPDGRVFNAGPNYRTGFLNTSAAAAAVTWTDGPLPLLGAGTLPAAGDYAAEFRSYGSAVMYQPGKIMVLGGHNILQGVAGVTNTTELIDFTQTQPPPTWQAGPTMHYPRFHANATLLADGTVFVSGGTTQHMSSDMPAVLPTELWKPGTNTWQAMAALDAPRLYHSTAVLLPDATVLTAGGGQGGDYPGYPDHPDYQIFTPPYLCQPNTTRPTISYAPAAVAYEQSFKVETPDASRISRATWVRLSSVTHSFNMNQRFLELPFTYPAGTNAGAPADELLVTAPSSANECPPGHYMLFLLDNQGVPSVARIMQVKSACAASLGLSATATRIAPCAGTVRFTVVNPNNSQTNYTWQVNGVAQSGTGANYIDCPVSNHYPTVRVRVTASRACGGPEVSESSSYTLFFPDCDELPYRQPATSR